MTNFKFDLLNGLQRVVRSALAITHHSKSDQGMPTLSRLKYFTLFSSSGWKEKEHFFYMTVA
jgi:hypothetical protein